MKKILNLLLVVLPLLSLMGCSDAPDPDVIWDIAPANVNIRIVDKDGNNLLDPETAGNWVGEKMTIVYEEKIYDAIWNREDLMTSRAYFPKFYGFVWTGVFEYYEPDGLFLGEFVGDEDHDMKLKFTVDGIDTIYEFEYHHRFKWKKGKPDIQRYIIYQGKKIEGDILTLVLPPNSKN